MSENTVSMEQRVALLEGYVTQLEELGGPGGGVGVHSPIKLLADELDSVHSVWPLIAQDGRGRLNQLSWSEVVALRAMIRSVKSGQGSCEPIWDLLRNTKKAASEARPQLAIQVSNANADMVEIGPFVDLEFESAATVLRAYFEDGYSMVFRLIGDLWHTGYNYPGVPSTHATYRVVSVVPWQGSVLGAKS